MLDGVTPVLDRRLFIFSGLSLAACSAQSQAEEVAGGINPDNGLVTVQWYNATDFGDDF